jgi:hypothetical protein
LEVNRIKAKSAVKKASTCNIFLMNKVLKE